MATVKSLDWGVLLGLLFVSEEESLEDHRAMIIWAIIVLF